MIVLNADEVRQALPMSQAIEAMRQAFMALASGNAELPLRSRITIPEREAVTLIMSARLAQAGMQSLAVKVVSVFPQNRELGLATTQGAVLVVDPTTGEPLALLEGSSLTAIRTGATAGAATDLLARQDSRVVSIIGAGVQGQTQLEAVCTVRQIERVWVYDPDAGRVRKMIERMSGEGPVPTDMRAAGSAAEAVRNADIICTATTALTPVLDDADVRAGTHINAVGTYRPDMQEIPSATIARSRVVVDSLEAIWAESGDLIKPWEEGMIGRDHVAAALGELFLDGHSVRVRDSDITVFKTVGVAVQDVAAAQVAWTNAQARGVGTKVSW